LGFLCGNHELVNLRGGRGVKGGIEAVREEGREGWRERVREGGRKGVREGGREGLREGWREKGREGGSWVDGAKSFNVHLKSIQYLSEHPHPLNIHTHADTHAHTHTFHCTHSYETKETREGER